jgi:hypothetical protein
VTVWRDLLHLRRRARPVEKKSQRSAPSRSVTKAFDRALCSVGAEATPTLASNSLVVLYTRVQTGHWASVMPAKLAETLGLKDTVRSIPT